MKQHDFLVCTFKGDPTVYVAEILNVFADRFDCRFVHSESQYTFTFGTWIVIKSTGAFPKGTPLTTHDLYTATGTGLILNAFASVTFANGKSYLGRVITLEPQVIRFLHKGIPVYVFENGKIINSGGIYPKGQAIREIKAYQLVAERSSTISVNLDQKGISYNGADFMTMASEIQGNIVKSHGRDHTAHIFFQFNAGQQSAARKFIQELAAQKITSALKQKQDSDQVTTEKKLAKQEGRTPQLEALQTLFTGLLLSAKAYEFLGLDISAFDPDFISGMKNANVSSTQMFDNPVENWERGYQAEMHGMILIAWGGETRKELDEEMNRLIARLQQNNLAVVVKTEKGDGNKNPNGDHIEHFGYVDGISQPKFFTEELSELKEDGVLTVNWNPMMPLNLVLVKDGGTENPNAFGSYFVFRKLEQDTVGFRDAVVKLGNALFGSPNSSQFDLAGAMVVGRFKNGLPVTLSNSNVKIGQAPVNNAIVGKINDFNYASDPDGARCPFHAHVRKTNPRSGGTSAQGDEEKTHMMARRGISYREQLTNPAREKVGLLFMSFQANIFQQFQHQQEVFANAEDGGKDPLIGQGGMVADQQKYAHVYNDKNSIAGAQPFGGFVTLKGGEYFFAPSLSFLKSIV